jgi:ATP-dependent DNA ligase
VEPMLAKAVEGFFASDAPALDYLYEPKWDGFRALVFKDGDEVYIQSRDKKPLGRYFPELVDAFANRLPQRCVLDGEIVVAVDGRLEFETLQMRLHPAKSRVDKLAVETPASFVAFDLLAMGDDDLRERTTEQRRAALEAALADVEPPVFLTPLTRDRDVAKDWFERFEGAGLDGVIAKAPDLAYLPKKRAMLKIKHRRTADCVVGGFRWHNKGPGELVGSLILGLFDEAGELHHVGVTSTFTMKRRRELVEELQPWRVDALEGHPWASWAKAQQDAGETRRPGMQSRWSAGKDLTWEPLRMGRVVEVRYDQLQGGRFRHGTTFLRWRDDKAPQDCRYDQLDTTPAYELQKIFGQSSPVEGSPADQGS